MPPYLVRLGRPWIGQIRRNKPQPRRHGNLHGAVIDEEAPVSVPPDGERAQGTNY
jgi:hypothetical protein